MMIDRPAAPSAHAVQIWVVRALVGLAACFVTSFGLSLLASGNAKADSPSPLGGLTESLNGATGGILEPVTELVAPPEDTGDDTTDAAPADPVTALVEPVTEAVAPVVEPVTEVLGAVVEPVTEAVAPVVEAVVTPVVDAAAPVVESVSQPVAGVLAPVTEAVVQPVVAAVEPIVGGLTSVTDGIAPMIDAVVPIPGPVAPDNRAVASAPDPSPTAPGGTDAADDDDGVSEPDAEDVGVLVPANPGLVPAPDTSADEPADVPSVDEAVVIPSVDEPTVIPSVDGRAASATATALADRVLPGSPPLEGPVARRASRTPNGSPSSPGGGVSNPATPTAASPDADPTLSGDASATRRSRSSPPPVTSLPAAATMYGAAPGADTGGSSTSTLAVVPTMPATGGTGASRFDAAPFGWHATTVLTVLERPG